MEQEYWTDDEGGIASGATSSDGILIASSGGDEILNDIFGEELFDEFNNFNWINYKIIIK